MEKPDKHIYRLWGLQLCRLWEKQGFVVLTILLLALLIGIILWNGQQNNVNLLEYKIAIFKEEIARNLSSNELFKIEDGLKLKKDILILEKDTTTLQNAIYPPLVQVIGGAILSITAFVGYCNFKIGEKNLKVAEDKQVTERFSKAIEHLGNEKAIDVRLGGIYALEQIAIDSPEKYHWTIVEILSAFVRGKRQIKQLSIAPIDSELDLNEASQESSFNATSHKFEKVGIDIQTALTVLGRRNVAKDPEDKHIDLRQVNLVGIELPNAQFSKIDLSGANLQEAFLENANLQEASLENVNLSKANITVVNFLGAKLFFANLNDARLTDNSNTNNVNLRCSFLVSATFVNANLSGADFYGAYLCGANFKGAKLNYVSNFKTAILGGMKVNDILLPGANFTDAKLSFDLREVNFADANLTNTNLSNAHLENANFGSADLTNTKLIDASLYGANLSKCKNLTQEQLDLARTYENAELPDYLNPPTA